MCCTLSRWFRSLALQDKVCLRRKLITVFSTVNNPRRFSSRHPAASLRPTCRRDAAITTATLASHARASTMALKKTPCFMGSRTNTRGPRGLSHHQRARRRGGPMAASGAPRARSSRRAAKHRNSAPHKPICAKLRKPSGTDAGRDATTRRVARHRIPGRDSTRAPMSPTRRIRSARCAGTASAPRFSRPRNDSGRLRGRRRFDAGVGLQWSSSSSSSA